ncbi:SulP family inorganic anion transporter [Patulibacter sp. SYSU D01012]|uniref:SulP family inorganic anion transporter n=1 Tax=Patulibacter sp. SYSU D01012 TaxID=2817381 RepID=UPI001FF05CFB|nr:SulP family inorganic anion transporter [Patulibacter sp. SYSU D01012]
MSTTITPARPRLRVPRLPDRRTLRVELLAGLVVALALIPEAISFSVIAGVDPEYGLYASFTMAVTIAIVGGRPAMISAATGAMALVVVDLVRDHGVEYLLMAGILAGAIQIALGAVGVAGLMRFVPQSVMTGFVNALAILIFLSQLDHLTGGGAAGWAIAVVGLATILLLPRLTTAVPPPLVAILLLTGVVVAFGVDVPTVGDEGELPDALPFVALPDVPFSLDTLTTVLPYSATLAVVGLLESLMTARLVDDITDTPSDKGREARGQGVANVVTGLFGGMPGCAMIGQTMINVRASGARTRLSTFTAGVVLLVLVVGLGDVVAVIPMTALVAVMVFVSYATFDWHSIAPATLRLMPRGETLVMALTVAATVATSNLAIGVAVGVVVSMALFARRVAHVVGVERTVAPDGASVRYAVRGALFFASNEDLTDAFHHPDDPERVVVDLTDAHVWDASAVAALDAVVHRYAERGRAVEIVGLDPRSRELHGRLTGVAAGAR